MNSSISQKPYLKVNKYLIFLLVGNISKFSANEKYLAVKDFISKDTIDIYEIPKEIDDGNKTTNKYGKLYCEINSKVIIQDFMLNPNYLDILVVVNTKKILFFTIPETFDKKLLYIRLSLNFFIYKF